MRYVKYRTGGWWEENRFIYVQAFDQLEEIVDHLLDQYNRKEITLEYLTHTIKVFEENPKLVMIPKGAEIKNCPE